MPTERPPWWPTKAQKERADPVTPAACPNCGAPVSTSVEDRYCAELCGWSEPRMLRYLGADLLRADGWHELAGYLERNGAASLESLAASRAKPGTYGLPGEQEAVRAALGTAAADLPR